MGIICTGKVSTFLVLWYYFAVVWQRQAKAYQDKTHLFDVVSVEASHLRQWTAKQRQRQHQADEFFISHYIKGVYKVMTDSRKIGKNANDIYNADYPELEWIVQGLLPIGMAIIGGRPKTGKSWITMQVAQSSGDSKLDFLGKQVRQGRVLYFALEDNHRRLKYRMEKQGWTEKSRKNVNFVTLDEFSREIGFLHLKDNAKKLYSYVEKGKYSFVVIDPFNVAFMGLQNIDNNTVVTNVLKPLHAYSLSNNVLTYLIDHHNKSSSGKDGNQSPIDNILGSTAKSSITDTALGVYKIGKGKLRFMAVGRDFEEVDMKIIADDHMHYCYDGIGELTDKEQDVFELLVAASTELKLAKIAEFLGIPESRASERLSKLRQLGFAEKTDNGFVYVKNGKVH